MAFPSVYRFEASLFPVNAYLVELSDEVIVIDSTLGLSDGRALRARVDATGKPLRAVIVTHAHPDHYGGLTALVEGLDQVPIFAVQGVIDAIRRERPAKEDILRPMFGDEWARHRISQIAVSATASAWRLARQPCVRSTSGPENHRMTASG